MFALSGENSLLAGHILPVLRESNQVGAFNQEKGDIADMAFLSAFLDELKPQVFINCEQCLDFDWCEDHREEAYRINGFAPGNIARLCRERNILLVHFSTSSVFDGSKGSPYTEEDMPAPVSVYGDSKLLGENQIKESGCRHLILRIPETYGRGRSFISSVMENVRNTGIMQVIRGQRLSTLYARDAALVFNEIISSGAEGIYNIANEGEADAAGFYGSLLEIYNRAGGREMPFRVEEVDFEECITKAKRPIYNVIDSKKWNQGHGKPMRNWKEALEEFVKNHHMEL